jgi:DNA repair exonuclease SbcCD nuclease subunit
VHTFSHRKAETVRIEELQVAIHGRSFPDRAVSEDFVPGYPEAVPGCFNIGLLHTSLTGRPGHDPYAPTRVELLEAKGYDYWALGHVHAREVVRERAPRIVFPGNLQGRAAYESGPKGCEFVTVQGGRVEAEFVPLDVVRWSLLDVDLTGAEQLDAVAHRFHAALAPLLDAPGEVLHAVRVRLQGTTVLHAQEALQPGVLAAAVQAAAQDAVRGEVWVEQVRLAIRAPVDRGAAAARDDAIGELARLVDTILADEAQLARWSREAFGALLEGASPELAGEELKRLADPEVLRELLLDGESTVHARLAASVADAEPAGAAGKAGGEGRA